MTRYAMVIRLRPEYEEAYRAAHAAVPVEVLHTITECNIRNYSIFLRDSVLFGYFEYTGSDFSVDMARMAADPATQKWWSIMDPMQEPFPDRAPGDWWTRLAEVFHTD